MATVLVTGANRGLGLGLVKKLLGHANPPKLVIATYRDQKNSKELIDLAVEDARLCVLPLEMSNPASFAEFAESVSDIVGDDGLNVLINNAGIGIKNESLADASPKDYIDVYQTNVVGPVFLTQALLPLVRKAAAVNSDKPCGMNRAAILNISSALGSVELNTIGRYLSYRESKAALNTFTRSLNVELAGTGILVHPIHPGWVQTDLGGPDAHLTIEESVSGMCELVYGLNEAQNGQFIQWDGKVLPW